MAIVAKLENGKIDLEALAHPVAEDSWRRTDQTPCPVCGHSLGAHAFPHIGKWYWACLAPIGPRDAAGDRPECGCNGEA